MSSSTSLNLADGHKLKGGENYTEWRDKVLNIAKTNGISKFLNVKSRDHVPKEVDEWDDEVDDKALKKWQDWESGESQMKLAITLNCKAGPLAHTTGKTTALDMWEALQAQYEGGGNVLVYNAIQDYVKLQYNDFNSLEKFIIAFKLSIVKLETLMMAPPPAWHPIMFIAAVSEKWPIWAERQRSLLRVSSSNNPDTTEKAKSGVTLVSLIEDITDEARASDSTGKMAGQALYGNKSIPKKGSGGGATKPASKDQTRPTCKHCKQTSPKHTPENCFVVNKQKKKEFEEKSGKKWIPHAEWLKKKEGESKTDKKKTSSGKKKDDDSDDGSIFGATLLPCFPTITASTAMFSHHNKSRWLFDTGATEHISNDLSKFTSYTPKDDLPCMLTVNGPLRPTGIGSCTIKAMKTDGTVRTLECYDTLYIPQSPVCLYSGSKLNKLGGYLRSSVLYTSKEKEICTIDEDLFIIEETSGAGYASLPGLSLPAAVEQATVDIELWHRRMCHASFDVVRRTQSMVTGMKFTELKTGRTRLCVPCEKGRPIRKVNKVSARARPARSMDEIHVDVVHLKPKALNGHSYASIFSCAYSTGKWAFTYAKKSDAYLANQKLIKLAETQYHRKIKVWRCDGGKEYSPSQMKELADHLGMLLEESTPYTPEQDGRAERSIRTIIEKVRTVMVDQNIPDYMWPEILLACIHIANLTSTSRVEGKTPFECFWDDIEPGVNHTPSVKHLRVLGCPVFILIDKEKRVQSHKVAPRAEKGILVGFEGHNIYRCLVNGKVVRTSHLRFDEDGLVTEPHEEDAIIVPQTRGDSIDTLSQNQDVEVTIATTPDTGIVSEEEVDSGTDAESTVEDEVPAPEVDIPEQIAIQKKRGRPPGPKNHVPEYVPRTTRSGRNNPTPTPNLTPEATLEPNNGYSHAISPLEEVQESTSQYRLAFYTAQEESPFLDDPTTLDQAMKRPDWPEWKKAVIKEYRSLEEKSTWKTMSRSDVPKGCRVLGSRLVFKTKRDMDGKIDKYKVRFVVQGHTQRFGHDYDQTYAGVCKSSTWKIGLAVAAEYDLEVEQFDVVTAFLHSEADTQIYVKLPPFYRQFGRRLTDDECMLLLKALYGLKQSPRLWQQTLRKEFGIIDFVPLQTDNCVYINRETKIIIVTYVDDFLVISKAGLALEELKVKLLTVFDILPAGPAKYFLGVRIVRDREKKTISLCQDAYIDKILDRFGMTNCKSADTPFATGSEVSMVKFKGVATPQEIKLYQQLCGSLQYLAHTRWDILYYCSILSQFLTNPSPQHLASAKRVLAYLQGTKYYATTYGGDVTDREKMKLRGFCDSDWAGNRIDRVSHTGVCFFLAGGVFSAISKRQTTVALASTEAEYVAMCAFAREASWIRQVLKELGYNKPDSRSVEMQCDNQGALSLSENPELHQRTKHIDIKFHYLRQEVARGHLDP
ncbi:hypothetical protein WAI453_006472 [Rhynchosporium graminicola]